MLFPINGQIFLSYFLPSSTTHIHDQETDSDVKQGLQELRSQQNKDEEINKILLKEPFEDNGIEETSTTSIIMAPVAMINETSWNRFMWVAPKPEDTAHIQINCPVVVGTTLIGVIDYVGRSCCRIRMIGDPDLHIAVRSVRGKNFHEQNISSIQTLIRNKPELLEKPERAKILDTLLEHLKGQLSWVSPHYLLKGEICGIDVDSDGEPIYKGNGFQYDFSDSHGHAHDLRSGIDVGQHHQGNVKLQPLILPGDILISSGLDGLIPEGLFVGEVKVVHPLMEGSTAYGISVRPAFDPRMSPKWVAILPLNPIQEEEMPKQDDIILQIISEDYESAFLKPPAEAITK